MTQSDYANIVLALTTLAQAPVANYPESGPFALAQQAQDIARAKLAEEARKKAAKDAKKKSKKIGIGKTLGTITAGPLGGAIGGGLAGGDFTPTDSSLYAYDNSRRPNSIIGALLNPTGG